MEGPQWFALLVRRCFERIVTSHLDKERIENYLPMLRLNHSSNGGKHCIEFPLFPRYVFCKCGTRGPVWKIPGVLSMARGIDAVQAVTEREITDLRRILASGLRLQPWPYASQGRLVKIQSGPLSGVTGTVQQRADNHMFVFSIRLIRRSIALKIDTESRISIRGGAAMKRGAH